MSFEWSTFKILSFLFFTCNPNSMRNIIKNYFHFTVIHTLHKSQRNQISIWILNEKSKVKLAQISICLLQKQFFLFMACQKLRKFSDFLWTRSDCTWHQGSVSKIREPFHRVYMLRIEILWIYIYFSCDYDSNNSVMSQFYTCPDNSAVVTCVKLWHDLVIILYAWASCISQGLNYEVINFLNLVLFLPVHVRGSDFSSVFPPLWYFVIHCNLLCK